MDTEARPGPRGAGEEPQAETAGQEDISQMAQFFRNSMKSLIVSTLALLSFKHRASKRKVSLGPGICGTASGPQGSWGGKQTPPEKLSL